MSSLSLLRSGNLVSFRNYARWERPCRAAASAASFATLANAFQVIALRFPLRKPCGCCARRAVLENSSSEAERPRESRIESIGEYSRWMEPHERRNVGNYLADSSSDHASSDPRIEAKPNRFLSPSHSSSSRKLARSSWPDERYKIPRAIEHTSQ